MPLIFSPISTRNILATSLIERPLNLILFSNTKIGHLIKEQNITTSRSAQHTLATQLTACYHCIATSGYVYIHDYYVFIVVSRNNQPEITAMWTYG